MEEEPGLPPGLCCACSSALTSAVTFKQLCLESAYHWGQATKSLEHIEDPTDLDQTYYIIYNSDDTVVIKDQMIRVSGPDKAMERITASIGGIVPKERKRANKVSMQPSDCSCSDCKKNFVSFKDLNGHLKGSMKRACIECGQVMKVQKYPDHMSEAHGVALFYCEHCYLTFDSFKCLQSHIAEKTSNVLCEVCSKGFDSARALRAHMYAHTLFHCSTCNRSFENRKCYKHHSNLCSQRSKPFIQDSRPSTFICDYCGAEYDKKPSLRIHIIQKHLNVLPFVCNTCGKRTSTLAHLKSHELIHEVSRKVYSCDRCNAKFRTELGFQLHQRIHSGNKPYMCDFCGDCFISASRRLDHVKRRHRSAEDMPHACEECPARFVRPFELKKHYLTVHFTKVDVVKQAEVKRRNQALKVIEEELCPPGVCLSCVTAVLSAQEFKCLVRNSHKIWKQAIDSLSTIPDSYKTTVKSICAFVTNTDNVTVKTVKDYIGRHPKFNLMRWTDKIKSDMNIKRDRDVLTRKPRTPRTGPACACEDCGLHFSSPYHLNLHLKNSGHKEACRHCGVILGRGREVKEHLSSVHKENTFLCPQCPLLFTTRILLKKHITAAHKSGVLTCSDCGRSFPRSDTFEMHYQMHSVRTCRNCEAQFTNRACYRRHRAECEPEAKPNIQNMPRCRRSNVRDPAQFICDYCAKEYHTRAQLKNHIIWKHMNVQPYECEWCAKKFYTSARLAEHKVVHTRERNFECDLCGARLVTRMALVYHRRRHTGERPYECADCGEKFISSSRRSEHAKRNHGKGFMFQCDLCVAKFARSQELRKHISKAHKNTQIVEMIAFKAEETRV